MCFFAFCAVFYLQCRAILVLGLLARQHLLQRWHSRILPESNPSVSGSSEAASGSKTQIPGHPSLSFAVTLSFAGDPRAAIPRPSAQEERQVVFTGVMLAVCQPHKERQLQIFLAQHRALWLNRRSATEALLMHMRPL